MIENNRKTKSRKLPDVQMKKDDLTIEVMAVSAKAWERNGWTRVDDGSSETDQDTSVSSDQAVTATNEEND